MPLLAEGCCGSSRCSARWWTARKDSRAPHEATPPVTMGFKAFLGYLLIGLGPGPALFFKYIAPKPLLLLLFLTGCFIWLMVLMLIALVWLWVLPADGRNYLYFLVVLNAVLVEEAVRYPLYLLIEKVGSSALSTRSGRVAVWLTSSVSFP